MEGDRGGKTGQGGVVNKRGGKRRKGGGVDGVFYCLCFINILLYKCQLYHFPHHCFTTPLALSSGTRGGTSLSLISLYCFSFSPTLLSKPPHSFLPPLLFPSLYFSAFFILYTSRHPAPAFLILPSCLFSSHGDASLAAPMKQVNFLPARRMNKSPWVCSERWGYLSKWSVSSSAQRY